ncbi:unnamed protein product [Lepeophtheirus salmonis]|uniref:(salmon louse) hypothetical protein n=1 Tax=Lepeophtheirus salmonis TaxID=72036 RepID=A0A7R8HC47_LEPSM|nr:unnamed protein product [Lepeophtheirus salmonis]CAF2999743.1 unnamed protein product [Lepeophtheirus salmonis]
MRDCVKGQRFLLVQLDLEQLSHVQGLDTHTFQLIWALGFASILAYTLQEGAARLTINSGRSLGECIRYKYAHAYPIYKTALICWIISISVFIGNTFYEANNFAGGLAAIYTLPPVYETYLIRRKALVIS